MTVEILPPLPEPGNHVERNHAGLREGFGGAAFKVVRVPPLLAWLLMIPVLVIILPILLVASLFFGFRLWRRMAAMPG